MKISKTIAYFVCYLMLSFQPAYAALISATTTYISGDRWESRYTITNDSLAEINWFTIYFQFDLYDNFEFIRTADVGAEWDVFTAEPVLGGDGFVDAFSTGMGIGVGQSLTNFVVRYNFFGASLPGTQNFEVYDPAQTQPSAVGGGAVTISAVSAPGMGLLFGCGLLAVLFRRQRHSFGQTRT